MPKYIGLFPYLYLDEPLSLGDFNFIPINLYEERNWPQAEDDKKYLKDIFSFFKDEWGNPIQHGTYYISPECKNAKKFINSAQEAVTLFRYALFTSYYVRICFEQTFFYLFELPPTIINDTNPYNNVCNYKCTVNFKPADFHVDIPFFIRSDIRSIVYPPAFRLSTITVCKSNFSSWNEIQSYYKKPVGLTEHEKGRLLVAIDWFNQTYQTHPVRDERGKIVDIATAFEVLLNLPHNGISGTFRACIEALLGGSPELTRWATTFYDTRSDVVHSGVAENLLYKHPNAKLEHLHFLDSAQIIFISCINTMLGCIRGSYYDEIIQMLTPSGVYVNKLRQAGSFENMVKMGMLELFSRLTYAQPVGDKNDIIWVGNQLLNAYKTRFPEQANTLKNIDILVTAKVTDENLGNLFYEFSCDFRPIYERFINRTEPPEQYRQHSLSVSEDGIKQIDLENAISSFTEFAIYVFFTEPQLHEFYSR